LIVAVNYYKVVPVPQSGDGVSGRYGAVHLCANNLQHHGRIQENRPFLSALFSKSSLCDDRKQCIV